MSWLARLGLGRDAEMPRIEPLSAAHAERLSAIHATAFARPWSALDFEGFLSDRAIHGDGLFFGRARQPSGFALSRGGFLAALRGNLAALLALPRVMRRRRLQRGRKVADRSILCCMPMTANPGLADRGGKAVLRRTLDRAFGAWWKLTRWACG